MDEPNFSPDEDELAGLREQIEQMRAKPEAFMELRGWALHLVDDLCSAYERLGVAYGRLDALAERLLPEDTRTETPR